MSTVISSTGTFLPEVVTLPEEAVRQQVWSLLSGLYPIHSRVERRGEQRFPYPYLVQLTPVAPDGFTRVGRSVVVAGKHLSERGLGFYHQQPLPFRRMIASLRGPAHCSMHFLIDVTWCRFSGQGWYDSGGKFLRAALDPGTPGDDKVTS
jgi:hypothetical protein